jgi:hypothetical protein
MPENQLEDVQKVLEELWNENLIPFVLTVGSLTRAADEYTIHFHDSRIRTANIHLIEGQSFEDLVRAAVLDRVARMSGFLLQSYGCLTHLGE